MIINLNKLNGGQGGGSELEYIVVEQLPSSGKKGAIYLVQKETSTEGDLYDEYIWINDKWEHIGTSTIDLSDYYTKEETDSTFATKGEIPTVPTQVSAFENDANYLTEHQSLEEYYTKEETDSTFATKDEIPTVPTNVSAFDNDAQYITSSDIPTQVSAFENDANYQTLTDVASLLEPYATKDEIPTVPTNVSELENDSNYQTLNDVEMLLEPYATIGDIPTSTSQLNNDSGFITSDEVDSKIQDKADRTEIPTATSQLNNDSNFVTSSEVESMIPTQVSAFENDANYLTEHQPLKTINNQSIIGEGNIEIGGGVSGDYLPLTGGTLSGNLILGSGNETAYKKVEAIRNVNDIPNGAAFYVNSDGTADFFHKTYASTALTSPINDAIIKFDHTGLYFAKGATDRTTATDFKEVLTTEKAYTKTEVDTKVDALSDKVDELQLFKFPNATIFGTPTIQNGQVSNFSNTNYLQFPFLVDFQNRPFDIYFSFTTPSDMSGQQNILDSNYGLAFAIRDSKVVMVASENGTSWTTGELISDETLSPNTTYYFRLYGVNFEDQFIFGYLGGLSTEAYSINKTVRMSQTPYPKTMVIGRSYTEGGNYFKGSINLNDASLTISNKVVWTGMDDVGLATRAAVDLSNLDAKGLEVIDNRVDNKLASQTITMVATLEDGSTVTYTLYGIEQQ